MSDIFLKPAAGGGDDGTSWTDAYLTTQQPLDAWVNADSLWGQGTDTLTVTVDDDFLTGTSGTWNDFYGVNTDESATPIDDVDGTKFVIDANSAATNCVQKAASIHFRRWVNIELKNATGDNFVGTLAAEGWLYWGCVFRGAGSKGYAGTQTAINNVFLQTKWVDNTSIAAYYYYQASLIFCTSDGNLRGYQNVSSSVGGAIHIGCVSSDSSQHGMLLDRRDRAFFTTIDDGVTSGISTNAEADENTYLFNRITNISGGYGLHAISANKRWISGINAYYNNSSGDIDTSGKELDFGQNVTLTATGYADEDNDDYTLGDTSEGRRAEFSLGDYLQV